MKKTLNIIFTSLLLLVGVSACGKSDDFVDYVAQTKLEQDYAGKEFFRDGIGEVTLERCVDGDTAHFKSNGRLLKVRFLGIDTPESTGAIEPYGKKAANYTASFLKNAKTIVIQSDGNKPEADSTGDRYLGWVWADGKLVNLAVVQKGYSFAKGYIDTRYEDVLYKADRQASEKKWNIWSGKKDDLFNYGDYIATDLKEINLNKSDWIGQKVVFNGIVTRKNALNCYVQQDFTNDDGTVSTYGIYIFSGYGNPYVEQIYIPGNYLKIMGIVAEYNGNLQITDISYKPLIPSDHDIVLLETGKPFTIPVMTIAEIKACTTTNILVKLENVTFVRNDSYVNENGMSINVTDSTNQTIIVRCGSGMFFTDENGKEVTDINYFASKGKMSFIGNITFYQGDYGPGSNQLELSSMNDVFYH